MTMKAIKPEFCQVYRRQDAKKADGEKKDLTGSEKELSADT
jgi:hypothetical protein